MRGKRESWDEFFQKVEQTSPQKLLANIIEREGPQEITHIFLCEPTRDAYSELYYMRRKVGTDEPFYPHYYGYWPYQQAYFFLRKDLGKFIARLGKCEWLLELPQPIPLMPTKALWLDDDGTIWLGNCHYFHSDLEKVQIVEAGAKWLKVVKEKLLKLANIT